MNAQEIQRIRDAFRYAMYDNHDGRGAEYFEKLLKELQENK
jgi:hypothetical protein